MKNKRDCREPVGELLAGLAWGRKTKAQLVEYSGLNLWSVCKWLAAFERTGIVVRVGEAEKPARGGHAAVIYALTITPFGEPRP